MHQMSAFKVVSGEGRDKQEWHDDDEWVGDGEGTLYDTQVEAADAAIGKEDFDGNPATVEEYEAITDEIGIPMRDSHGNQRWRPVD